MGRYTEWVVQHFKNLATKKHNENFDDSHISLVEEEVAAIYMICLDQNEPPVEVTDEEMDIAIKSLNRGKAPDGYGVTAEHVYYGGQDLKNTV